MYLGSAGSMFPMHKEDGNLFSANILLQGSRKLWVACSKHHEERVEEILSQEKTQIDKCKVFYTHKSFWINLKVIVGLFKIFQNLYPQKLAEKVPLFYTWQNEGDVILTSSYHQGYNEGANINIAMGGFNLE